MHSLLITRWWTIWLSNALDKKFCWYRLCYNLFSIGTFIAAVCYQLSLPQVEVLIFDGWQHIVQVLLYAYAFYMFFAGAKRYDMKYFLGLQQIEDARSGRRRQKPTFSFSENLAGGVRHPWYSAGIALVLAFPSFTDVMLAAKSVLVCYLVIGTKLEERKLRKEFGDMYVEYCRKVPMLFPRLIKKF